MRRINDRSWSGWLTALAAALLLAAAPAAAIEELPDADVTLAVDREILLARGVDADEIDVETADGVVTLSGTVDNLLSRDRAVRVASMVKGVRSVVNRIEVVPPERSDEELVRDLEQAFVRDPAADSWEIDVASYDGRVRLTGRVDSWQERELAGEVAKGVRGIVSLDNAITVARDAERPDAEIENEVEQALLWNARIDDALIEVDVENGEVRLTGTVGSAWERTLARSEAWVAGVDEVDATGLEVQWWARDDMVRDQRHAAATDREIEAAVRDALLHDPRVFSFEPEVSVDDGVVTLTGHVDNLEARRAAAQDAANTAGVWRVVNHLRVRPVEGWSDEEIERSLEAALVADPFVDRFEIEVDVDDGVARLSGHVDSYFQKWQAEEIAARTEGVTRVRNHLDTEYEPWTPDTAFYDWDVIESDYDFDHLTLTGTADWEIRQDIRSHLFWSPFVDADEVEVEVEDGVATLTGTVSSWIERSRAAEEALEAGAVSVDNDLAVDWGPEVPLL